jgi:hypothetical protein
MKEPEGRDRRDGFTDKKPEFLLIEFEKLQDEIQDAVQEIWRLEWFVVIGITALLAWAFSSQEPRVHSYFFAMPFLITLLASMRATVLWLHIKRLGSYLTRVEEVFGVHPELGWELRLAMLQESKLFTVALISLTMIFWVGTLSLTAILAINYNLGH